jgi:Ca-activated chloride channel family protein
MLEDGTAVGDGLGVALTRLERKGDTGGEPRKGAFVILLTDGASNRGAMEPLQAADIARARGIPVYSIGAGTDGFARVPVHDREGRVQGYRMMQGDLDEPTMREIASRTGGKFFRAMSSDTVMEAFRAIDKAQKIEFQATVHEDARELFAWPAGAAVLLSGAAAAGVARRREVVA